ncbi:MAG: TonB-dependent receptor [Flavobacteriaceae bacterium]|nr:TonB-dependent receptor [Flavobacteriaceae bacterium]
MKVYFTSYLNLIKRAVLLFLLLQVVFLNGVRATDIDVENIISETYIYQEDEVKGIVTDVDGMPLIGVNILVKGTKIGAMSDFDGNFMLNRVPEDAMLVFTYMGYHTKTISLKGRKMLSVVLEVNVEQLHEVVVVGYGTQKKSDVTGAISSVSIDDFEKSTSPYATQALQGLVSGVSVISNTGAPGEGAQIRIRGIGSISGGNTPLYIVDGVPTKNAMDYLSPMDIENISVLKDAASAAIYGSRANNGVVIITTKKGKKGTASRITFSSIVGIQNSSRLTKMANTQQYIQVYNEAVDNDNAMLSKDEEILFRKKITPEYAETLGNVNHLDEIFRSAMLHQYHLGYSGSSEKSTFNISGGYFDQEGILLGSSYTKITGKISVSTELKDWLTTGVNLNVYKDENHIVGSSGDGYGGNGGSAVRYAFFRTSAIPVYDAEGNYMDLPDYPGFFGDGYNPVGLLNNQDNVRDNQGIFGDVNFRIKLSDKFSFTSTIGLDRSNSKQRRFNKMWGKNDRINDPNSLVVITGAVSNWSVSNVLSYNTTLNEIHNITALLGAETIVNKSEAVYSTDHEFTDQKSLLVKLGNGKGVKTTDESSSENKLQSFFGRVNYNYNEKYFASALVRRDGSSRFKDGNRWGTFYSASLGWRIDKDFFQDSDVINSWMFRLGYGSVGDQEIPNFAYLELIGKDFNYPFGEKTQQGSATVAMGNSDVLWATSNQIDIGTDISLFNGKLKFILDYYNKTTENMLLEISIPSSGGYAKAPIFNSGKVQNSGFEFEVNYNNRISDDFSYSVKANAALLKNEVLELANPILGGRIDNGVYATKTEVGQSIGAFYLYEMDGIFQNDIEIVTSAFQGNNIFPGDVKYKDINNDGVINDLDRSHVGSPIPDVTFGFNVDLNYKNFDFSMFWAGAVGQELYYQIATDTEGFYRPFNITKRYYDERWTGEGTSNTQPRASWSAKSNNTKPSTRFLEDGSFLRLKNVQLGYNFPSNLTEKLNMERLRIYATASNLLTFTKYPGLDPEFSTSDNSKNEGDLASGIDWGTYPNAVSISLGLQLTF